MRSFLGTLEVQGPCAAVLTSITSTHACPLSCATASRLQYVCCVCCNSVLCVLQQCVMCVVLFNFALTLIYACKQEQSNVMNAHSHERARTCGCSWNERVPALSMKGNPSKSCALLALSKETWNVSSSHRADCVCGIIQVLSAMSSVQHS